MMSRRLLRWLVPALAMLSLGTAAAQDAPPTAPTRTVLEASQKAEVLAALEEVVTKRAFVPGVDLSKWPEFLAEQRETLDRAEDAVAFGRAVNLALNKFGISHIRFLTPRTASMRRRTTSTGVGVRARKIDDGLEVRFIAQASGAEKAGVQLGDVITLVDGKAPENPEVLDGEAGTEVTLTIRDAKGASREVKLKRETFSIAPVDTLTWVGSETAVLKVHSFGRSYRVETIEKLMQEAAKAKYLVLDLRGNGGGSTGNLRHLLSLMLPPDTKVGTFVGRRMAEQFAEKNGPEAASSSVSIAKAAESHYTTRKLTVAPFPGKIAVLINRGSASASEIGASALREVLKAPVVGARSAGAVLGSLFRSLPHGFEIQYPINDYVTRDGMRLEKNPLVPDHEVTGRPEPGKDPVLTKALEVLGAPVPPTATLTLRELLSLYVVAPQWTPQPAWAG